VSQNGVGPPEELPCTPSDPDCPVGRALGSDDVDATGTDHAISKATLFSYLQPKTAISLFRLSATAS
jgi:hypothetical protein